jgi:hypothetical protein
MTLLLNDVAMADALSFAIQDVQIDSMNSAM